MVNSFYLSFSLHMNSLLPAIAITGCQSPSEVNQKGCSSNQPLKGPRGPQSTNNYGFDAKMVNIADIDYSANVNSGMRPVFCFFPLYFAPYKENEKGCSLDKPLLGSKIPLRPYAGKILMQKWLTLQILISLLMPFLL